MENNTFPGNPNMGQPGIGSLDGSSVRTFLANVFGYMSLALIISGLVAWWFAHDLSMLAYLIDFTTGKQTILGWVVLFAPLGLVLIMSGAINRLSGSALLALFLVYSAVNGMTLSYIFLAYTAGSIASVFFISAAVFATMAIAGYTTKTDLTKLGSILFIGLIGIVIAGVVNMFMQSDTMGYIISIIGVIVFTGLTAYDVQKLKAIGEQAINGTEQTQKMALMGALRLYLDFINLFLMLLRLFGRRN